MSGLRDLSWAVVDLETSGGRPKAGWDKNGTFHPASEITEVGLVQLAGSIRQEAFTSLCAVEGGVPPFIQRLTGITPRLLEDAPTWQTVALRMAPLLESRVWVAHNAPFDGGFLKAYLPEGLWRRHTLVCTVKLAKLLVPEAASRSLGALCETLALSNRRPHRALPDAEATAELLQVLLERAEARNLDAETLLEKGRVDWGRL